MFHRRLLSAVSGFSQVRAPGGRSRQEDGRDGARLAREILGAGHCPLCQTSPMPREALLLVRLQSQLLSRPGPRLHGEGPEPRGCGSKSSGANGQRTCKTQPTAAPSTWVRLRNMVMSSELRGLLLLLLLRILALAHPSRDA